MRSFLTVLTLFLIAAWSLSGYAADDKKVEKKIWVQKEEKKAGLGIMVTQPDKEKDGREKGACILQVFEGSEADAIGLEKGDIIIEINKQPVEEPEDLVEALKDLDEGQEVSLTVIRDGQKKDFKAVLKPFSGHAFAFSGEPDFDIAHRPHTGQVYRYMQQPKIAGIEEKGGYLGVQVKNLSDQLEEYFEVKHGVLIEEVMKDSPAEKAGLKAGDVITAINDRKIEDPRDLVRTVNYYNPGEEVDIIYTRKGRRENITVTLTEKPGFNWNVRQGKGPQGIQVIKEGDNDEVLMDEKGGVVVFKFKDDKGNETVELNKEILIL